MTSSKIDTHVLAQTLQDGLSRESLMRRIAKLKPHDRQDLVRVLVRDKRLDIFKAFEPSLLDGTNAERAFFEAIEHDAEEFAVYLAPRVSSGARREALWFAGQLRKYEVMEALAGIYPKKTISRVAVDALESMLVHAVQAFTLQQAVKQLSPETNEGIQTPLRKKAQEAQEGMAQYEHVFRCLIAHASLKQVAFNIQKHRNEMMQQAYFQVLDKVASNLFASVPERVPDLSIYRLQLPQLCTLHENARLNAQTRHLATARLRPRI